MHFVDPFTVPVRVTCNVQPCVQTCNLTKDGKASMFDEITCSYSISAKTLATYHCCFAMRRSPEQKTVCSLSAFHLS